jgi:CheY-like chemotaxis protein
MIADAHCESDTASNDEPQPPVGASSILLVEDDEDLRGLLALALERVGYAVCSCANGLEALQWLYRGNAPAIILLDLQMPVMDGWTFIEHKKADPELTDIPVVVLSGSNNMKAVAGEVVKAVPKPFDFVNLLGTISRYVGAFNDPSKTVH